MKKEKPILITLFYHGVDLDGWTSSALVEYFSKDLIQFEDREIYFRFNEWNYGFKLFDKHYANSDFVIMSDIVLEEEQMNEISDSISNPSKFYVFDHHATQKDLVEKLKAEGKINEDSICDSDHSATYHVFEWIKKNLSDNFLEWGESMIANISTVINIVDLWDTHNYVTLIGKDDEMINTIKKFKAYVESVEANICKEGGVEFWHSLFDKANDDEEFYIELDTMCNYGEIIEAANIHLLGGVVPNFAFPADFEGYKMLCVNSLPSLCSSYFGVWDKTKEFDLICVFYFNYRKSEWSFSIRKTDTADDDIDLVPLWEKYNIIRAGGHKGAGSIRCKSFEYDFKTQTLELKF